jgi:aspartate/tyrosine/aromatic aminotransferase
VGCFSILCTTKQDAENVLPVLKSIARTHYSNPPKYGAELVDIVLSDSELSTLWKRDLQIMSKRISTIRNCLYENLIKNGSEINWDHLNKQIGMFAYTGLTSEQCQNLKNNYHIYMTEDGRMSLSGLTPKNVEYVAKCIHEVTKITDNTM